MLEKILWNLYGPSAKVSLRIIGEVLKVESPLTVKVDTKT